MEPDYESIRQRAHEIWEAEGRPEGRETDHWQRARAELLNEPEDTAAVADSIDDDAFLAADTDLAAPLDRVAPPVGKEPAGGNLV